MHRWIPALLGLWVCTPLAAREFAWGCSGRLRPGGGSEHLRILEARGPGSPQVSILDQQGRVVLSLTATGPLTETVVPNADGAGNDGIRELRVYQDGKGRRWLFSNWDAHPSFRLNGSKELMVVCTP